MKTQSAIVTHTVPTFESLLQKMTPHFKFFAKRVLKLKGDDFDDVLQELSAIAYEMYLSLVKRGKEIFYTPLLKFSIKRYREGRRFIGSNSTDALADKTRVMGRTIIKKGDTLHLMLDQKDNVARAVQFKLDFTDWYHRQGTRDQQIITDLAMSETTNAVAKKFGVTAGAISIKRRTFEKSWHNFINPPPDNDSAVVKK